MSRQRISHAPRVPAGAKAAIVLVCLLAAAFAAVGGLLFFRLRETAGLLEENKRLQEELNQQLTQAQQENDMLREDLLREQQEKDNLQKQLEEMAAAEVQRQEEETKRARQIAPENLSVGDVVDETLLPEDLSAYFTAVPIEKDDEIYQRINRKSYRDNPNIALSELRYLRVLHYNFDHKVQVGEVIVNQKISDDMLSIFREFYDAEYEIQSLYLVDNYWTGDGESTDTASIEVNNSSAFNYRPATGSSHLSNHAYGMAIDINPQQNPYLWKSGNGYKWTHRNADPFINRNTDDPHVIKKGDFCYNTFAKYGFTWGGEWTNPIDYQHFQKES